MLSLVTFILFCFDCDVKCEQGFVKEKKKPFYRHQNILLNH